MQYVSAPWLPTMTSADLSGHVPRRFMESTAEGVAEQLEGPPRVRVFPVLCLAVYRSVLFWCSTHTQVRCFCADGAAEDSWLWLRSDFGSSDAAAETAQAAVYAALWPIADVLVLRRVHRLLDRLQRVALTLAAADATTAPSAAAAWVGDVAAVAEGAGDVLELALSHSSLAPHQLAPLQTLLWMGRALAAAPPATPARLRQWSDDLRSVGRQVALACWTRVWANCAGAWPGPALLTRPVASSLLLALLRPLCGGDRDGGGVALCERQLRRRQIATLVAFLASDSSLGAGTGDAALAAFSPRESGLAAARLLLHTLVSVAPAALASAAQPALLRAVAELQTSQWTGPAAVAALRLLRERVVPGFEEARWAALGPQLLHPALDALVR